MMHGQKNIKLYIMFSKLFTYIETILFPNV